GGGNEYFALCDQQLGGIDGVSLRKAVNGAVALPIFPKRLDINSIFPIKSAIHFGDANQFVACLGHQTRRIGAYIAKTLNNDSGGFAAQPQFLDSLFANQHDAAAGSLAPPKGMFTTAHFQVIQLANARTSSSVTSGE